MEQHKYWDTYYRCVEKLLNTAQNNRVAAVKNHFFKISGKTKFYIKYCCSTKHALLAGYLEACKGVNKLFISLDQILVLRNDTTGMYFDFIEYFFSSSW